MPGSADPDLLSRAHLNLVESSRLLMGLDPGAEIENGDGWLFGAATPEHPLISNAAYRTDDALDPGDMIERSREFFGARGRGYSLWARAGLPEDEELIATAEAAGFRAAYEMPEMTLTGPVAEATLPAGSEMIRLSTAGEAEHYWRVAASSYESIGFPPEVFGHYEGLERLAASDGVAAFLATLDGEPVSIATTIVSHGIAGIYWVGSVERARGRGLGRSVTAAATNAGLAMGAGVASLQASPMGAPIYLAMGYEAVYDYRLLLSPAPTA